MTSFQDKVLNFQRYLTQLRGKKIQVWQIGNAVKIKKVFYKLHILSSKEEIKIITTNCKKTNKQTQHVNMMLSLNTNGKKKSQKKSLHSM